MGGKGKTMMKKQSRVAKMLGIEYPVIQAAMNWLTSAELAAAVSNAGGCGLLGPNAGQSRMTADINETVARMHDEVRKTASLTDKPFGIQVIDPRGGSPFAQGFVDIALAEPAVKLVLNNGYLSQENLDKLHDAGKIVIRKMISDDIATFKETERMGYDAVVATGVDCGGHTNDKLKLGTLSILRIAKEAVDIPVIAAGGMIDSLAVEVAGLLGAEGIYCGTRFVVSKEGPAAQNCKELMCSLDTDQLIEFNGMWGSIRSTKTETAWKCYNMYHEAHNANKKAITDTYSKCYKVSMLEGDLEGCLVDCGASIGQIREILSCKEIIEEYAKGME